MRRVLTITAAIALILLMATASFQVWSASPTVGWRAFEQKLPAALNQAGLNVLSSTMSGEQVPLPLPLRIRQVFEPRPMPALVGGFPESVEQFTLESVRNSYRIECLVRYSRGMVACVVLRYPSAVKAEAARLRNGLRQISSTIIVRSYESTRP